MVTAATRAIPGLRALPRAAVSAKPAAVLAVSGLLVALPFAFAPGSPFLDDLTQALAYTVMALGLNIIVGFAGLLDFGYVVFYAIGAYAAGWFASGFFDQVNGGKGLHIAAGELASKLPGIHLNFVLVLVAAVVLTTTAGVLIGVPTLRLRADYIAVVTLAFGEIVSRFAVNGDAIALAQLPLVGGPLESELGSDQMLTGGRFGITPVDKIALPGVGEFRALDIRPWYWTALALAALAVFVSLRLRHSRIGRAWAALREDEVAAVSMGVPLVKAKLLAYGIGAAFGGMSGAFLGSFHNSVNAEQFEIWFSVFVLAMVVLGGIGSIWGVVAAALTLSFINIWLLPDVLGDLPRSFGLDFELGELSFAIYGGLLLIMMILRPEGLLPGR
jgi:branched-chain amino acid transport system permease protein